MKAAGIHLFLFVVCTTLTRADLVIVQRIEGAGPAAEMTIKMKGEKARIDASPQLTTIIDGKNGEVTNVMNDQKAVVRISADKMKAAMEMMNKYSGNGKAPAEAKPKLVATGKKEKINGYDTEEYLSETPSYKATYWIASNYPNGPAILQQLQSLNPKMWSTNNLGVPDYRDFPGVPIKTVVVLEGNQITTTLVSIKQEPVSDSDFVVPKDFKEIKTPDINEMFPPGEGSEPGKQSPPKP